MDAWAQPLLDLIKAHSDWAAAVMFITAFGESFAFVSLLFPGTTVLIAAGTLLSGGTLPYASILISAILGALVMQSLQSGMTLLNFDSAVKDVIVGSVLVFAVWIDQLYRRRQT